MMGTVSLKIFKSSFALHCRFVEKKKTTKIIYINIHAEERADEIYRYINNAKNNAVGQTDKRFIFSVSSSFDYFFFLQKDRHLDACYEW